MTWIYQRTRNNLRESAPIRLHLLSISLLLGLIFLSGCVTLVDTEGSQEQRSATVVTIKDGEVFKQTILSRRRGLNQIELWLRPSADKNQMTGYIKAELRSNPGDSDPVAEAVFTPAQLTSGADTLSLSVSPQNSSENTLYELSLRSSGGAARVLGSFEDVYGPGAASFNGNYLFADMAFRISYHYNLNSVIEDMGQLLSNAYLLLTAVVVLLLPGWLLMDWSSAGSGSDRGEKIAIALGLSLSVIPLVMLWTSRLGFRWNRWTVLATYILMAALLAYRLMRKYRDGYNRVKKKDGTHSINTNIRTLFSWPISSPFLALSVIFLFTIVVRVAMVRDLSAPPWVDSVHHALITQLIMDRGALPTTFAPYIQIDASSYHPGFHSVIANNLWLSNADLMQGMLFFGQLLNALSVFSVYLFTTTLLADVDSRRLAGLLAAMVAGLFTPMPAYYTSWGRYTQLAAMIILPAAFMLMLQAMKNGDEQSITPIPSLFVRRGKLILTSAIALAGIFLTHFRVTAFLACLLLAYTLVHGTIWILRRQMTKSNCKGYAARIAVLLLLIGGAALFLASPWMLPSLRNLLLPRLSTWIPATAEPFSGVTWPYLNTAWGNYAMVLAGLGIIWGLLQRRTFPIVLALWTGLLFFIANLGMFGLPGSGFVNSISVTISLYLPLAVLAGYILSQVVVTINTAIPERGRQLYHWSLAATALVIAVLAARPLISLLNPVTFLFRPADRPAIAWAQENIPIDETVLVNPFAWGYGQYAGNDGGYWISAIGDHATFPPPVLYGLSNSTDYINNINTASQQIIDLANDPDALHALLHEQGIRFIFIGGRGGVLSPQALYSSQLFAPRYARDGAFIYEVLP